MIKKEDFKIKTLSWAKDKKWLKSKNSIYYYNKRQIDNNEKQVDVLFYSHKWYQDLHFNPFYIEEKNA
jgi:hypothetical protein